VSKVLFNTKAKANEKEGEERRLQSGGCLISKSQGGGNCKVCSPERNEMAVVLPEPMCCIERDAKIGKRCKKEKDLKERKRGAAGRGAEQEQC